ncbi:RNA-directed DNA polymerase, eukaryota [Tanacetum coccineum]
MERLVSNLCTIWVGGSKFHANVARFHRTPLKINKASKDNVYEPKRKSNVNENGSSKAGKSYAHVLKTHNSFEALDCESAPSIVLDDDCLNSRDLSKTLLGRVKRVLPSFVRSLRLLVSGEEILDTEDQEEMVFILQDYAIYSKLGNNIYENFKVIFRGKVFVLRAKEIPGWVPEFADEFDDDDESEEGSKRSMQISLVLLLMGFPCKKILGEALMMLHRLEKAPQSGGLSIVAGGTVKVGTAMGYSMNRPSPKGPKEIGLRACWGNYTFDYAHSDSVGNSGGILCIWDPNSFQKDNVTVSDFFIIIRGTWLKSGVKILMVAVYAPHDLRDKKILWDYLEYIINRWDGEVLIMGDFNEVRRKTERFGSVFNVQGADMFNMFIANAGLEEIPLGGSSFTWCHKSATKMSKLDRFLISENLFNSYPDICATSLDRFLSDHRPILLRESNHDYGPIPFRYFNHWTELDGFNKFVIDTWNSAPVETNAMRNVMKKFKFLKGKIREWLKIYKSKNGGSGILKEELNRIDADIDKGLTISIDQQTELEGAGAKRKVKKTVWDCGSDKSPGPIQSKSLVNPFSYVHADDAMFCGQWCDDNINTLVHVLECFFRASGLRINMSKSKIMGVNVGDDKIKVAASKLGCLILNTPFTYLVPLTVLRSLESIRCQFFNGHELKSNKSSWVKWNSVLAAKEKGGLGVSSLFALNRALLMKWFWRFYSHNDSLWSRVIKAIYGVDGEMVLVLEGSGEFSVASIRRFIDDQRLLTVDSKTLWIKSVPIKVNILAWKIKLEALPRIQYFSVRDKCSQKCSGGIPIIRMLLLTEWIQLVASLRLQSKLT